MNIFEFGDYYLSILYKDVGLISFGGATNRQTATLPVWDFHLFPKYRWVWGLHINRPKEYGVVNGGTDYQLGLGPLFTMSW